MCFLVCATNMRMYNENTQQNTPRKIVWDSLFSPLSMDLWRAFKRLTLIVCTLKQTETSHPTSKFSKISTNRKTFGQNPPVFCMPQCFPHIYRVLYLNWLLGNVWSKIVFVPINSLGRCIKVTQFNKIKSWLRSLPQCCGFCWGLDVLMVFRCLEKKKLTCVYSIYIYVYMALIF